MLLLARVSDYTVAPTEYLHIVQGGRAEITFAVEDVVLEESILIEEVKIKFQDTEGNSITIEDVDIERLYEEDGLYLVRSNLEEEETILLEAGLLRVELLFDDQKAVLTHSIKIVADIEEDPS